MTLRPKLLLALLPPVLLMIAGLGWWHYSAAAAGVGQATRLYLDTQLDGYLEGELERRHRLLRSMGVEGVRSFNEQYQREALEAADRLAARHRGEFLVIDREGVLRHATGALAADGVGDALRRAYRGRPEGERGGRLPLGGAGVLYAAREGAPWGWTVLFLVGDADYRAALDGIRDATLAVAGLLALLIPVLIYLFSQRLLLTPIDRLGGAAERIAHHEPVSDIDVHGGDELGGLARNMEKMAHDIESARRHLEERVRQRTEALEEKSRLLAEEVEVRHAAQRALEQTGSRLEDSNRELQQFAYVVSHDLQEPLRMVSSYLQLIERRYHGSLDDDAREFIAFAVDGATRMAAMIDGLLEYSRVDTQGAPFAPISLEESLTEALANLQLALEESGAEVARGALPELHADAGQMTRLFQNLIANALKFHGEAPPRVSVEATRDNGHWRVAVSDNGIGLDVKFAERIFTVFQRLHTRDEYPGTGIGLAVCKRIVERHGGTIAVESRPGRGATFVVTLPAAPEAAGNEEGSEP